MDRLAAPELDTPVVRIMVGDNNLDSQQVLRLCIATLSNHESSLPGAVLLSLQPTHLLATVVEPNVMLAATKRAREKRRD